MNWDSYKPPPLGVGFMTGFFYVFVRPHTDSAKAPVSNFRCRPSVVLVCLFAFVAQFIECATFFPSAKSSEEYCVAEFFDKFWIVLHVLFTEHFKMCAQANFLWCRLFRVSMSSMFAQPDAIRVAALDEAAPTL
jgi:hypothetical protein